MSQSYLLFDKNQYLQRYSADQREFEADFKQHAPFFIDAIEKSFNEMHKLKSMYPRGFINKLFPSNTISGYMRGLVTQQYPESVQLDAGKRFHFVLNKRKFFFKKFDKNYVPSNIPTIADAKIKNQLTDSELDKMPIIFLGYQVSDDWQTITSISAVYLKDNKVVWVSDLTAIAEQANLKINYFDSPKTEIEEIEIKLRKGNSEINTEEINIELKSNFKDKKLGS